jgi:uncharacterized membrane protein YeaQ/YmgE (transglycosylase-associated protein family)
MELLALVGMASVRMPAMRALLTLRPVGWNVAGFLLDRGLALARGTTYHLYPIGWIVVGFLAGVLSGMVVQDRSARGCLLSVLVGIPGGIVGGWLGSELRLGDPSGFLGSLLVAFVGGVIIRLVITAATARR